jgi:hypothetical protein
MKTITLECQCRVQIFKRLPPGAEREHSTGKILYRCPRHDFPCLYLESVDLIRRAWAQAGEPIE